MPLDLQSLFPALGIAPASAPAPVAEPTPAPVSDAPSLLQYAGLTPPEVPQSLAEPAPSPLQSSGTSTSTGRSLGVTSEQAGFSPGSYQAIQAGPRTALDRRVGRAEARAEAGYQPVLAHQERAAQAANEAIDAQAAIEAKRAAAVAPIKTELSEYQAKYARDEQGAIDNARVSAQAAADDYRAALMDYSAAGVNPSQLWESAGTAGQFGFLATAFAHDFLGAKGIKTSGLESLNASIKRNIDAQLAQMQKKGEVAQGFKTLWDMQRSQSATDAEARARMHGFYLEAFKGQIDATLSGYDSKLARAKAQAAKAALDQEQVKNELKVRQHIDEARHAAAQLEVTAYGQELQAATSRAVAKMHIEAEDARAERANKFAAAKAGAEQLAKLKEGLLVDTSKAGGNTAIRRFLPDVTPVRADEYRQQTAKATNLVENIDHLLELQAEAGKVPPGNFAVVQKLQDEAKRTAETVRQLVKTGLVYDNTGKAVNEQEFKIWDQIVGANDWWVNGDNVRTLSELAKLSYQKNDAIIRGVSEELQPSDPYYGYKTGGLTPDQPGHTLAEIRSAPGAGRHVNTEVESLAKEADKPVATAATPESPADEKAVADLFTRYLQAHPTKGEGVFGAAETAEEEGRFANLYQLAKLADQPQAEGHAEAKAQLEQFAGKTNSPLTPGYRGLTETQQRLADEAAFLLEWIKSN